MTVSNKHPLFDFGESEKEKHELELQKAFQSAYLNYITQGGPLYGL